MGAVTYPNEKVAEYVESYFAPVQINIEEDPGAMERYHTPWTPTIIIEDANGVEHRRSQGYLDPKSFIAELALARLKAAIDRQDFAKAQQLTVEALQSTAGDTHREAEAMYWSGVATYKNSNDSNKLIETWNRLIEKFPETEWARKASFIKD